MNVNEIRRIVNVRPFEPLVFHLDNGETQRVSLPEIIVTDIMIIGVDEVGKPVYIVPEAITAIRHAPKTKPGSAKRLARKR